MSFKVLRIFGWSLLFFRDSAQFFGISAENYVKYVVASFFKNVGVLLKILIHLWLKIFLNSQNSAKYGI